MKLVENLTKAIDDKQFTVGIFVDLAKAFDIVDHKILLNKLEFYGIRGIAHNWLSSYLRKRKQYVSVNEIMSNQVMVKYGVPHGSILGLILFLLYVIDLNYGMPLVNWEISCLKLVYDRKVCSASRKST